MKKIKLGNQGSAFIELVLILPMVLGIVMLGIYLMLDCIYDSVVMGTAYTNLYTYNGDIATKELADTTMEELQESIPFSDIYTDAYKDKNNVVMIVRGEGKGSGNPKKGSGVYGYELDGKCVKREQSVCSDRLRRWQLYGDVVWE